MSIVEYLAGLRELGVQVRAEEGNLRVSAPEGILTGTLRQELLERKSEVLEFLRNTRSDSTSALPPIQPIEHSGEAPLSFAQQRLWFLDLLSENRVNYNVPSAFTLKGRPDIEAIRRSLDEIIRRHKALRTTFETRGGEARQIVRPPEPLPLNVVDLTGINDSEERRRELEQQILQEALAPFDLAKGPLLRAVLWKCAGEEYHLLLTIHHIVCDGWSLGVLNRELALCYAAFASGQFPSLPPLPIHYIDFAVRQREWMQDRVMQSRLAYWRQRLEQVPPLHLPLDYPRPAIQVFTGGCVAASPVPASLVDSLQALAKQQGVTLFMTTLAAFYLLLHRYSGQFDLAVGTTVAGRSRSELEGLIGFFVNTLVLRTDLSGEPSFRELLERVRETTLGAFTHQDVPFEKLVEDLSPERDLSRAPLTQVLFTYQNNPERRLKLDGLTVNRFHLDKGTTRFDLEFHLWNPEGEFSLVLLYDADLFRKETIERMASHYRELLESIIADPDSPISRLNILDQEDRRIIDAANRTEVARSEPRLLHQRFEKIALRNPEAPALRFEETTLSYGELNRRADHLAALLREMGVRRGDRVGLCLERSTEMIAAILGVLKAGAAYLPVEPDYPSERLRFMLEDAGAAIVLTQSEWSEKCTEAMGGSERVMVISEAVLNQPTDIEGAAGGNSVAMDGDDLCYVIYTSGSTGRPKGVMNRHEGVLNTVEWFIDRCSGGPDERYLLKTPYTFDVSVLEIFGALLSGGCLVAARPGGHREVDYLRQLLRDERVTLVHFVPSMINAFLDGLDDAGFPDLCRVVCAGEALPPAEAVALAERLGGEVENMYGPTEASIIASAWHWTPAEKGERLPIGYPIANGRLYVLDNFGEEVPVGVAGELYIGGTGVALGYMNRPALTAEHFVPDRFSGRAGERLYRTGDLVRRRADGIIEYIGRADHQVKVRGQRIELGEIESVLCRHQGITAAAVRMWGKRAEEQRLAAYLVAGSEPGPDGAALREHLRQSLPEWMIPVSYTFLPELPLTPSGKVDRQALPEPDQDAVGISAANFAAPDGEAETTVADIWAALLGIERVGRTDNLFDLGAHSLMLMQFVSRVRDSFGVDISLQEIFRGPTVAELAVLVEERREAAPVSGIADILAQIEGNGN